MKRNYYTREQELVINYLNYAPMTEVRHYILNLDNNFDKHLLMKRYIKGLDVEETCEEFGIESKHFHKVECRALDNFYDYLSRIGVELDSEKWEV